MLCVYGEDRRIQRQKQFLSSNFQLFVNIRIRRRHFCSLIFGWVKVGHSVKSTIVFDFCAKNRLGFVITPWRAWCLLLCGALAAAVVNKVRLSKVHCFAKCVTSPNETNFQEQVAKSFFHQTFK